MGFVEIPDFNRYKINKSGVVISYADKHNGISDSFTTLKGEYDKDGYIKYVLFKNGRRYKKFAHRLVAKTYLPNPDNKPQVNHLNGLKNDNRVENLEWCTLSENRLHSYSIGLENQKGEKNANCKLDKEKVLHIRNGSLPASYYANKYNVSKACVLKARNRITWKHI